MGITGIHAGGKPGYQSVFVGMGNPGNRMIKPALSVGVTDASGRRVLTRTTKLDTFLPNTHIDYPVIVQRHALPAGTYQGTVVLRLGGRVLDRFTGKFTVSDKQVKRIFGGKGTPGGAGAKAPWKLIALGVALLLALVAVIVHYRRKARRLAAGLTETTAPSNGNGAPPAPARRLGDLPPDQRAVLGLLVEKGESYDEIGRLVSMDPEAVRLRAHASLTALAPVSNGGSSGPLTPGLAAEVGDYLLGQQSPAAQVTTRELLTASAGARAWAQAVAGELRTLGGERLPDIPE
jgi:hypothetical protein